MSIPSRVGIVGLGLMGGSLARALKSLPRAPRVAASSLDEGDLEAALREGVVDEGHVACHEVAQGRDLVVYATPLEVTLALLEDHRDLWSPGSVITDVASLKGPVLARARSLEILDRFVGSHPMTGGEGTGYAAGRGDLYLQVTVWLVQEGASEGAISAVEELWTAVGADPRPTDALEHDDTMVRASHLPQLLANVLAGTLARAGLDRGELGPGGRDMTRLAGSSPEMWRSIFRHAGSGLVEALEEVAQGVTEVAASLESGDVDAVARLMERTRGWVEGGPWS